ncbi:putative holin-like toxin [Salibacterium sp. K-3]
MNLAIAEIIDKNLLLYKSLLFFYHSRNTRGSRIYFMQTASNWSPFYERNPLKVIRHFGALCRTIREKVAGWGWSLRTVGKTAPYVITCFRKMYKKRYDSYNLWYTKHAGPHAEWVILWQEEVIPLSPFEALSLMVSFGMLIAVLVARRN